MLKSKDLNISRLQALGIAGMLFCSPIGRTIANSYAFEPALGQTNVDKAAALSIPLDGYDPVASKDISKKTLNSIMDKEKLPLVVIAIQEGCPMSKKLQPALNAFSKVCKGKANFIGLFSCTVPHTKEFVKVTDAQYPHLSAFDKNSGTLKVIDALGKKRLERSSTFVIISPDGTITDFPVHTSPSGRSFDVSAKSFGLAAEAISKITELNPENKKSFLKSVEGIKFEKLPYTFGCIVLPGGDD